ncbi:unnamed protein product [Cylicostephanus goldi]|uniref:Major facilitator superfamily (MFS) profile domain-containing protein n=1 Tax=Cylicostephanus goldi TaxID=71465 RepID=A0A3P6RWA0_CYLGO|nr:unnamed protein product [Cylicostephanus goldi]
MQSLLLSATFYGGLVTISFAGVLADRYGPKTIVIGKDKQRCSSLSRTNFTALTIDYIVVTLLTPFLARHSYVAYFISRVIMGVGEGFVFPCFASLIGKWYAPAEKSTVAAMYTSGNQVRLFNILVMHFNVPRRLAAGFSSLFSSYLCTLPPGWPIIFYLFGAVGCLWLVLWMVFVTNSPTTNRFITMEEREYLVDNIKHTHSAVGSLNQDRISKAEMVRAQTSRSKDINYILPRREFFYEALNFLAKIYLDHLQV